MALNLEETAAVLATLYVNWKSQDTPEQLENELRIWQWAFENDDIADVAIGVRMWLRGGNAFMPKPAQVRELMAKMATNISPEEEWARVSEALQRYGRGLDKRELYVTADGQAAYREPITFHELTQRTINQVGETFLRNAPMVDARKAFIFTCREILEREREKLMFGDEPIRIPSNVARTKLPETTGEGQVQRIDRPDLPELEM